MDDDADALAANFFENRSDGTYSTVVVRAFFQNPTNIGIDTTNRFYTSGGLGFFPVTPFSVTAESMVFNRSGALYYVDVPCRAEAVGSAYIVRKTAPLKTVAATSRYRFSSPSVSPCSSSNLSISPS